MPIQIHKLITLNFTVASRLKWHSLREAHPLEYIFQFTTNIQLVPILDNLKNVNRFQSSFRSYGFSQALLLFTPFLTPLFQVYFRGAILILMWKKLSHKCLLWQSSKNTRIPLGKLLSSGELLKMVYIKIVDPFHSFNARQYILTLSDSFTCWQEPKTLNMVKLLLNP